MYNTLDSMEFLWPTIERIYQRKARACGKGGTETLSLLLSVFYLNLRFMSTVPVCL